MGESESQMMCVYGITSFLLIVVAMVVYEQVPDFTFPGFVSIGGETNFAGGDLHWSELVTSILTAAMNPRFAKQRTEQIRSKL